MLTECLVRDNNMGPDGEQAFAEAQRSFNVRISFESTGDGLVCGMVSCGGERDGSGVAASGPRFWTWSRWHWVVRSQVACTTPTRDLVGDRGR
eukprot:4315414-Prymnesium_polylepis.1